MLSFGHFDGTRADAPHASGAAKAPGVASPPNRHAAERCAAHAREDAKLSGQHATARQANTLLTDREREAECTSGATGAALRGLQRQWFWPWFWPLGSCLFLDTLKPPTNSRGGGDAFLTASETAAQAADSAQSSEKDSSTTESPAGATSAPLAATLAGGIQASVVRADVPLSALEAEAEAVVGSFTVDGLTYAIDGEGRVALVAVAPLEGGEGKAEADASSAAFGEGAEDSGAEGARAEANGATLTLPAAVGEAGGAPLTLPAPVSYGRSD